MPDAKTYPERLAALVDQAGHNATGPSGPDTVAKTARLLADLAGALEYQQRELAAKFDGLAEAHKENRALRQQLEREAANNAARGLALEGLTREFTKLRETVQSYKQRTENAANAATARLDMLDRQTDQLIADFKTASEDLAAIENRRKEDDRRHAADAGRLADRLARVEGT